MQTPDSFGTIGSTIKVAAGHYVDLVNPDPATLDLETIAAALGKLCRFGGHTCQFYSVAEHSWMCCRLANYDECPEEVMRAVLLHDAAEAYLGDIVKPLKLLLPEYCRLEERMERAIMERFDVDLVGHADKIRAYDRQMLKVERNALLTEDNEPWADFDTIPDRNVDLAFYSPIQAASRFLSVAASLGVELGE
ncbi:HD domain-containing protein [Aureliella helgolandensis]|uniref:HD domain-containing protein n=1 Tax=Aureliella helgolandensis TaxID=2527968 RepID=A0A518G4E2_9BACT|nr:HD domain-containing protein [Aureliella helgolandensis]QDV23458.1 hypothetical protein Q31a_17560 [Aureliella helgolandensis]